MQEVIAQADEYANEQLNSNIDNENSNQRAK